MAQFKVAERFVSINGESARAGELAVFIRFAGCNLNCGYCDTKWANEKDTEYELLSDEDFSAKEHCNSSSGVFHSVSTTPLQIAR